MALSTLITTLRDRFAAELVPATVVYGQRDRAGQLNAKSGTIGGRVSILWTGEGKYTGSQRLNPRSIGEIISRASLLELVNELRVTRPLHWAEGAPIHLTTAPVPILPGPATTPAEAVALAEAIRTAEEAHHANLSLHAMADTVNPITAPTAKDYASLRTLLLDLQAKGNAHDAYLGSHAVADDAHDSIAFDPLQQGTTKALYQMRARLEVEIWAWDDGPGKHEDELAQWEAWLSLHNRTMNELRLFARGNLTIEDAKPTKKVVHVRRGLGVYSYVWLPVPVLELPFRGTGDGELTLTAGLTRTSGQDENGASLPPVTEYV